jgi:hypothetical protein
LADEAGVLPLLADGQRKLIIMNEGDGRLVLLADDLHAGRHRGRESAEATNFAGSLDQSTMSIFSGPRFSITARTLAPPGPMNAPSGLTPSVFARTAILRASARPRAQ